MALADEVVTAGCRLSVCLSVCLPVARLLSQEGCVLVRRRGGKVGASVGRRGGAEALGWTAPPWLLVGLGTGQVSGRMGAQGPGWVAPRPTGGSEARGPRGSGGGRAESQKPLGRVALGSERDRGRPGSPSAAGPGEAQGGGRQDLRAPQPTPPGPVRTHAWHAAGGPGSPPGCRTWPGVCWPRGGSVRGHGGIGRPESGRGSFGSSTACTPVVRCSRLA